MPVALNRLAAPLCVGISAFFIVSFLFLVYTNLWPGPIHDYWFDIPVVRDMLQGSFSFAKLVSAHANVHRLLVPRLLFYLDFRFFHGTNTLLVFVSLCCKFATWWLFNHVIGERSRQERLWLNIAMASALFNAINIGNFLNSSNIQWDLMSVFSCFAIHTYVRGTIAAPPRRYGLLTLAYAIFTLAFFSQGGSLPVMFVFLLVALVERRYLALVGGVVFVVAIIYLTAYYLPVNDKNNPGFNSAIAMLIFKPKYVALFVLKLMSANVFNFGDAAFVFSAINLSLLALALVLARKTRAVYHNIFLYIAVFAFLMMVFIAAFRVDFAPGAWASNRYHPNVLLFILALMLHGYFCIDHLLPTARMATRTVLKCLTLLFCLVNTWVPQYIQYSGGFSFANTILEAQASALFYGPDQDSGRKLVTSLQEFDKVADANPFFTSTGSAWYTNKMVAIDGQQRFLKPGDAMIPAPALDAFAQRCRINHGVLQVSDAQPSGHRVEMPFNTGENNLLAAMWRRNTWYVLDSNGNVDGFAWLFVDPEHFLTTGSLRSFSNGDARYVVTVANGVPRCLYQLQATP